MGFRFTKIRKATPKHTSAGDEILKRLDTYINQNEQEPLRILDGHWKDMQDSISYQEIREYILKGDVDQSTVDKWTEKYSQFVTTKFLPVWEKAMDKGTMGQPSMDDLKGSFTFDVNQPYVWDWIDNRAASFVTNVTDNQVQAMRALIRQYMYDEHSAEDLAKVIRPCVGLTTAQSKAVLNYYDKQMQEMREAHPRMSQANLEAKCRKKMLLYAENLHRERAMTIAQTEISFAYNHGMQEAMRQAMEAGLVGTMKKMWITALEHVCDRCLPLNGTTIGFYELWDFDKGGKYHHKHLFDGQELCPPLHPRCRCCLQYIETAPPTFTPAEQTPEAEVAQPEGQAQTPVVAEPKGQPDDDDLRGAGEDEADFYSLQAQDFDDLQLLMSGVYHLDVDESMRQLPFEDTREICHEVEKVMKEFPNAQFAFNQIILAKHLKGTTAYGSATIHNGFINLNPDTFLNKTLGEQHYQKNVADGYHPKGTLINTVSHECGHLLESAVIGKKSQHLSFDVYGKFDKTADNIVTSAAKSLLWPDYTPDKVDDAVKQISIYSTKNRPEAIAEAVADYMANGEKANPLSIKIWEVLKKKLK